MVRVVAKDLLEDLKRMLAERRRGGTDRIGATRHAEPGSFHPHGTMLVMGRFPEVIAVS